MNPTTPIVFSEKRTLVSDFSPIEMLSISRTQSRAEARKYFITKYVIPLALTIWYQKEDGDRAIGDAICCIRLLPTARGLVPHLSFSPSTNSQHLSVSDALIRSENEVTALKSVFRTCPPELWGEAGASLDEAVMSAFEECLPTNWATISKDTLEQTPLIASIMRSTSGVAGDIVTANVLVKTRTSVRNESVLLNQAESKDSPKIVRASKKYKKMYNMINGSWIGTCERNDPDICDYCAVIHASAAANNAYDDPDFS